MANSSIVSLKAAKGQKQFKSGQKITIVGEICIIDKMLKAIQSLKYLILPKKYSEFSGKQPTCNRYLYMVKCYNIHLNTLKNPKE